MNVVLKGKQKQEWQSLKTHQSISQSRPGKKHKIRAGFYLYMPINDNNPERGCYEIEKAPEGMWENWWMIYRDNEKGDWMPCRTLKTAIAAINTVHNS